MTLAIWPVPGEPVPVQDALRAEYLPFAAGQVWGTPWLTSWLHVTERIPPDWAGRRVEAVFDLGFDLTRGPGGQAEGLVHDRTGRAVQGLHPYHRAVLLAAATAGGEDVDLYVELAANPPIVASAGIGVHYGDPATAGDEPLYRLAEARLAVREDDVWQLLHDAETLDQLMRELPESSSRRHEILHALGRAVDAVDPRDVAGSAKTARAELADVLSRPAHASAHRVSAVGHAHIDSAWLWPVRETVRKCVRTFTNQLALAEEYPELVFACSSAQQYAWVERDRPEVFERIRAAVDRGTWAPVGGMWVESDANLPGGEALARQLVHGRRYFADRLGVEADGVWLPDSFGYTAAFPQLARLAGARWFLTQKLSWNETNRLPHHTFSWEGIDGTTILTHFPPVDTYTGMMTAAELAHAAENFAEKGVATRSLVPFGYGDGGGGPTRDMLERARRLADLEGSPRVTVESPAAFFQAAAEEYPDPPVWRGELYLETHRGTYTSQARTKRGNRRAESLLREAELWAATAAVRGDAPYPYDALDRIWKTVLLLQFHDILPGSAIAWVHREAERDHRAVLAELDDIVATAAAALPVVPDARRTAGPGVLNAAPFPRTEVVRLPADVPSTGRGVQRLSTGEVACVVVAPALGAGGPAERIPAPVRAWRDGDTVVVDNRLVQVRIDGDGLVRSVYDHAAHREAIAAGEAGNLLQLHPDDPTLWSAWNLDRHYRATVTDLTAAGRVELLEDGPLLAVVRVERAFGESRFVQDLEVAAGSRRLTVRTAVDWQERDAVLKAAWPLDVHADDEAAEIQFGHVRRPTHVNTSWDAARYEKWMHRWVHVGEHGWGVALLNDSTYGYDTSRRTRPGGGTTTTVRLTLLRAPHSPDAGADRGRQEFTYALEAGAGLERAVAGGYALNLPLRTTTARPAGEPLVAVTSPALIEAVKLADDRSGDVVVRLYEPLGGAATATLTTTFPLPPPTTATCSSARRPASSTPAARSSCGCARSRSAPSDCGPRLDRTTPPAPEEPADQRRSTLPAPAHLRRRLLTAAAALAVTAAALPAPLASIVASAAPGDGIGDLMYPLGVGADLGPEPATLGLAPRAGDDPAGLRTGELDGRGFWGTDVAAGTGYLAFDLDDDYVASLGDSIATVSVAYHDTGSGDLVLTPDGGEAVRRPYSGAGGWAQAAFDVSTADLAGELRLTAETGGAARDVTVASVRIATPLASVGLGDVPATAGIAPRAGDAGTGLLTGTVAGRSYWSTNRAAPAPGILYFYMNVDDSLVHDTTDTVLVGIDYFDQGNGALGLHYDSPGPDIPHRFKSAANVQYGDTGTWRTHTYALTDAILTNRSNGSDFRVHDGGSPVPLRVAEVRVTVVPDVLDAASGLLAFIDDVELALGAAREGDRDGEYPPGSKAELSAAVAAARAVADRPDVTEAEVKPALIDLHSAHQAFLAAAVDTNVAVGATATASGTSAGSPAEVVDDDTGTVWTSAAAGPDEWLRVDLRRPRHLDEIGLRFGALRAAAYTVEGSVNGRDFHELGRGGAGLSGRETVTWTRFEEQLLRSVRVRFDTPLPGATTVAVRELELRDVPEIRTDPHLVETVYPTDDVVVADLDAAAYGADPSGAADSTAAIQEALWDCYDAGGGTVWLGAGTYRVTGTVEVPAFCTLRGDRRDPDTAGADYGTVISAELPPGDDGPVLFRVGGSAGVRGLTTYYPAQDAADPVPYNYTFELPGRAWRGEENYMMSTIAEVTMLNSYRGIGVSTMPSDRGEAPANGQVHESSTVRDVRGTVLFEGVRAYNGADVGTWEDIRFDNGYWASAPAQYQPPERTVLDAWTRANGTGLILGDLEWDEFTGIELADYATGIHVVPGQRVSFAGSFLDVQIRRTDVALQVEEFDSRWGLVLAGSTLEGSEAAVVNRSQGFVKVTDTELSGPAEGIVHRLSGDTPEYEPATPPKPQRAVLYDVTAGPFGARGGNGYQPAEDATVAIQRALDQAGADGGGVVYVPAGWYRVDGRLRVPAGVELRGASAVPNREQGGLSRGTILMTYAGRDTAEPETAPAFVTLDGDGAGVRGLRIFHPENNPNAEGGLVPYPYAIRGAGTGTYVIDVGMANAWNAIDLATERNDGFYVQKVTGAWLHHGISVGASDGGRIEGVLVNGNAPERVGFFLPDWQVDIFPDVIDAVMRPQTQLITVDGATGLTVLNAFAYGVHDGLVVSSGEVNAFNVGTDNLGTGGYSVAAGDGVEPGDVVVTNVLRYNGVTTVQAPVVAHNIMVINIEEFPVTASASPAGTVTLTGNQTIPGHYERGAVVTATATPAAGHVLDHWTVNGMAAGDEPVLELEVSGAHEVVAVFAPTG
ncbi:Alpha-mannosidase [Jiangella alkaliphila]|uniref:Alpha-mannosidase n=2 Tax=Jiangella alkaliphila TaxID=419479 RepID=A0A1H2LFX6_9ACTN|nr:Alpha-mannosidase [Jiangella alkaliphila]